ncbi:MAG: HIT domain-containing protein [Fimbriimonadaceae bacterium]|nr:HIT domain-containing protein [Fimbriimonadaceae bacterium]QYK58501.1 MAG: HIT domain-containing protein [Fimbriimonadaceae bacterium]
MLERLWAPWRFGYVQQADSQNLTGNIFVDLPNLGDDREALILHRGTKAYVLMNAYPYTSGHLLVAPYREVADIVDLGDDEHLEVNQLVAQSVRWLREVYRPDGFNIGVNMGRAAGAGIPQHVHWHVVPRWSGDTNFMTTVSDVRVIPQDLRDAYDRIHAVIDRT